MDHRGHPADPSETAAAGAAPDSRVQAWRALAYRIEAVASVPTQSGRGGA